MRKPGLPRQKGKKGGAIATMTQAGSFLADPDISQAGGGAQTPTAQALGHAAPVYQTPGALPTDGAQAVAAVVPEPRPAADGEPHKLLDRWTRLHPHVFGGKRHEDALDFIDRCRDRLHNMRILESHGVDITTFQLEDRARRWRQSYVLGRSAGSPPITLGQFTQLFWDRYIPPFEREKLRYTFEQLEQGQMSMTDYKRVWRFIVGLHSGIRANMAREMEMGTSYQLVVEIAWRIEGYLLRGREKMQKDKRTRFSGDFRGASARGRGQFGRGQPSRPLDSAPPPTRGAPACPYFNTMLESSYRPPAIQGSSSGYSCPQDSSNSYFSAMPESSYCPPAIQASSNGSISYQTYRSFVVTFYGFETRADLLLLDMIDFEVIQAMDWLSPYHVVLDCHAKTVTLAMLGLLGLEWKGSTIDSPSRVISFLKARHMVEKGCLDYLAYVRDTTAESPMIDSVQVVWEFADMFPSDLSSMPPDRDIDLCIDLAPGT
ncbi:uncharacterized protein [Nicotiana sylvestris]|uniref:uncharacterized protein n=1 Tax=Nicotiana sylvestris TaxID=4096 RepID=UPI00388CD8B6